MAYTYTYKDNGYSRRHRAYEMADGSTITALVTRYTYQMFYKPAQGPRGGKARKECARSVYYKAGVFYMAYNAQREDGTYYNSIKPFEGTMWDCHAATSKKQGVPVVTIETIEGVPVSVKDTDGTEVWAWGDDLAQLEDMLGIPEQDRAAVQPAKVDEATETTTTAEDENEAAQLETARVQWLESTTCEGQQMDLIAYLGYGDATWRDIAA